MADFSKLSFKDETGSTVTYNVKDSSAFSSISISNTTVTMTRRDGTTQTASLPADTKQLVSASSTKMYLTGVGSTSTTSVGYANSSVYATNGQLNGNELRVAEKVKLQYNSTTESLDFIFE